VVVRLRDNTYVPYVPTSPYERIRHWGPLRPALYSRYPEKMSTNFAYTGDLDLYAGAILLMLRDVFSPKEPLTDWFLDDFEDNATMSSTLKLNVHGWVDDKYWFSRGGMIFEPGRNPVQIYLPRNEIPAAIRSIYNGFVVLYYPDLNAVAEEFHEWGHASSPVKTSDEARRVNDLRQMLVREDGDTLWLAGGTPRRCLAPGKKIEVRKIPTYFGPVSYTIQSSASSAEAWVELPTRNRFRTACLVIRAPQGKRVRAVEIDGKPWKDFDASAERIRLPVRLNPIHVSAHF
jgi:hypothetical protein